MVLRELDVLVHVEGDDMFESACTISIPACIHSAGTRTRADPP